MKRILTALALALLLCTNISAHSTADAHKSIEEIEGEMYSYSGIEDTLDYIPSGAQSLLGDLDLESPDYKAVSETFSMGGIINTSLGLLRGLIPSAAKNFSSLIGILILVTIVNALKSTVIPPSLGEVLDLAGIACLSGSAFMLIKDCFDQTRLLVDNLCVYMRSMIYVMTSFYALGGNVAAASASGTGLTIILNVIQSLNNSFLIPLLEMCFALLMVTGISNSSLNLSGVSRLLRSVFTWTLTFVMTALTTILAFQTYLASSADTVAARGIRFAAASFVPVVGGLVGEAVRTVMASLQAVKAVSGVFGIAVIAMSVLPCLLYVLVSKLYFKLASAIAAVLGINAEAAFLAETEGLLNLALGLMFSASLVFILAITIFINTSAAI